MVRRVMRLAMLLVCSLAGQAAAEARNATASPIAPGAKPIASYHLTATLEPHRHSVTGSGTIRWQNPSDIPAHELYLHAYLNAFSHSRTRFMRAAAAARRSPAELSSPGSIKLTQLVAREFGDANLLPQLAAHSPEDPDDATDLRVELPGSVAPGALLTLQVQFEAILPELIERAGFSGNFYAVAQWFPKVALRDSLGTWHHFAYDSRAEFSSDFGDYDITLDVPAHFVIAAPGIAAPELAAPGRRRERYCVTSVHDFAWFASDEFVLTEAKAGPVDVRHYGSAIQTENARLTLATLRWGLERLGAQLFPYPYTSLTVVHPPDRASAAGGMEYPLLITTGGPWYLPWTGLRATESVTIHELAHQWFYGAIASDEYLDPVLDEGLASWVESQALAARFTSSSALDASWFHVSEAAWRRVHARQCTRRGPLAQSAPDFGDFAAIAGGIYSRFPTLLETLERVYGAAPFELALRHYATQYRFRHPSPDDFLEAMRTHLPARAADALSTALYSNGWVDYAVSRIIATRLTDDVMFSNRILIERRGTFDFPIVAEVEFADGHVAQRHVDSVSEATWLDWPYSSPIVAVTLDPDHRITIDDDIENQTLRIGERPALGRLAAFLHMAGSMIWSMGWP